MRAGFDVGPVRVGLPVTGLYCPDDVRPMNTQLSDMTTQWPVKVGGTRLALPGAQRHPVAHTES